MTFLADLTVLVDEHARLSIQLTTAQSNPIHPPLPVQREGLTYEMRHAHLEAQRQAQQWRAHVAALEETLRSLVDQIAQMTEGASVEETADRLKEMQDAKV